ncbi:FadR/GntR family transcriptional regulator [Pseudoroseomonas globiformis]|uniref:FadR/GntR family transcriptional regulator n=1 Tax=Teichococcus globiformis TaxID=2307229 RepID=A0ABV7G729_9PROT
MARLKNLYGQVQEKLGRQIATGTLPPGPLPPEKLLSEQLGVSRVVLREAVKALAAKGMVSVGPSIGTRVLPRSNWHLLDAEVLDWHSAETLDRNTIADLIELRRIIEPEAARLAARRATSEDLAGIRGAYRRMEAATVALHQRPDDYVLADAGFHTAVLVASHNQFLCQMQAALSQLLRLGFSLSSRHPGGAASTLPFHEALLHCLERRDPDAAAEAVHVLIARNERHFRSVLCGATAEAARTEPEQNQATEEIIPHAAGNAG